MKMWVYIFVRTKSVWAPPVWKIAPSSQEIGHFTTEGQEDMQFSRAQ